eukprot:TRINITY_DN5744_c0_g1_i1.p1 TRINITY_DN5744_c0_g1~~TRINITY_DN5744_c0_g1_i1.p1  ORF type:complete len:1017 (+),score=192.05 TRINITY_DN5744_c0_g1_i1:66-3116(+)
MQDPRVGTPPASPAGLQGNPRRMSVSTKVSEDDYFILDPQDIIVRREVQQLLKETTDMFEARLRHMKESFDMQMATAMGAISRLTHELTVERDRRARIERYVMTALRSPQEELEAVLSGTLSPRNAPSLMAASQSTPAIKPGSPRSQIDLDMPIRNASSSDAVSAIATSPRLRLDLSRATASGTAVAQATITSNSENDARTTVSADAASPAHKMTSPRLTRTQSASIINMNGPSSPSTSSASSDDSPRATPATIHDSPVVRERSGTVMALPSAERSSPTASPRSRNAASSFSFLPKRNPTRVKTSDPNEANAAVSSPSSVDQSSNVSATATSPSTAVAASATVGTAQQPKKEEKDTIKDKKKRSSVFGTIKKTLFRREKSDKRTTQSGSASIGPVGGGSRSTRGPNSLEQLFSQVAADPATPSTPTSSTPPASAAPAETRTTQSDSAAAVAPIRMDVIGAEIDFTACELVSLPLQVANRMDQISGLRLGSNKFSTWPELASPTLIELDLSLNDIPAIPPTLSKLPNLRSLFVFGNKIGKLPAEIGQLAQLQLLDLSRNSLTELPAAIGSLSQLRELFVFGNKLTAIPPEIKNCVALETLDAGENMIRFLPDEICQLTKLRELNLYLNKISFLPEEIGNLTELRELNLAENFLQDIPLSAGKLKLLGESINLSSNRFADDGLREAVARGPQETMAYLHRRLYNAIVPVPSMQPEGPVVVSQLNLQFAPKGAVEPMNVWPDSPKMRASPRPVDTPTPPPSVPEASQTTSDEAKSEAPAVGDAPTAPESSPVPESAAVDSAATSFAPPATATPSKEEDVSESSESMSASASASTPRSPDARTGTDREAKKAMVDSKIAVLIKWAQTVVQEDLKPELERVAALLARNPTQEVINRTIATLEAFEKSLKRIHQHLPSEFHDSVLDGLLTKLSSNLERKKSVMNIPTVEVEQARQDLQIRIIDVRSKLTIMTNMLSNRELGNHTMIDVIMTVKEMKVSLTAVISSSANQPVSVLTAPTQPAN